MKTVVLLVFCFAFSAWAQERADTTSRDTYSARIHLLYDTAFPLGKPGLLVPPSFETEESSLCRLSFISGYPWNPSFVGGVAQRPIDLTASFRLQLDRHNQMSPLMNVLGTVQAGAAAYIAYRHIKKYGFLK